MRSRYRRLLAGAFAALAACATLGTLLSATAAYAAGDGAWPTKPVKIIVPYPAGGQLDITARLLGVELARLLGQPFYVDNVPGASGKIGMLQAVNARDGHTAIFNNTTAIANSNVVDRKPTFDVLRDFKPVAAISKLPLYLVVNDQTPARSLRELIAFARQNPGKLNYGSYGIGTPQHYVAELLKAKAGIDIVHVPFKGDEASQALMSNAIQVMFLASAKITDGASRLHVLGVAAPERGLKFPGAPTLDEQGVPGVELEPFNGLFVAASAPDAAVQKLNEAINVVMKGEAFKAKLAGMGYQITGGPPEALGARIKADVALSRDMLARGELKLE